MRYEVSHLHGRAVLDVVPEPPPWGILLDGQVLLENVDEQLPVPQGILGTTLLSSQDLGDNRSRLVFGRSATEGPQVEAEILIQQEDAPPTAVEELPPDPSGERVAEGPQA